MNFNWITYFSSKISNSKYFKTYKSDDAYCIRFGKSNNGIGLIQNPVKEIHSKWSIPLVNGWWFMRLSGSDFAANREVYLEALKKGTIAENPNSPDAIRKKLGIEGYLDLSEKRL